MTEKGVDQRISTRSLAAIMFTDIVGFTALMGESEEKALRHRRLNREIHQEAIEAAGGAWLMEMEMGMARWPVLPAVQMLSGRPSKSK